MRSGYKAEGSKLFLAEKAAKIYEHAIQRALQAYAATQRNEYKDTAFMLTEKSKAGIMRDALSEAEAKQFAGIPDSLLEKERRVRIDLAFYEKSLLEEQGRGSNADFLRDKVFSLKQSHEALRQRFEENYPDYYNLKYQNRVASVAEVRRLLDERTAVVEYFTGEDSIFIFAVTHDDFIIKASRKDSALALQIERWRHGIIKQDFVQYTQAAVHLYQTLLAPVAEAMRNMNLIIVPDAALSTIPF
ncbi:hypothetical protein HUU05_19055 [candidate division KSB1 bacterium]|nr:hypothetical protein [candidate division KSB1 bacterium]